MLRLSFAAVTLLACVASPAFAQLRGEGSFRTPSQNIGCQAFANEGEPSIRCDLREMAGPRPRRPADCEQDYGQAFEVSQSGRGQRICHGDTAFDPDSAVLGYGQTWTLDGIVCASRPSGMLCRNAQGGGFEISRGKQRLF